MKLSDPFIELIQQSDRFYLEGHDLESTLTEGANFIGRHLIQPALGWEEYCLVFYAVNLDYSLVPDEMIAVRVEPMLGWRRCNGEGNGEIALGPLSQPELEERQRFWREAVHADALQHLQRPPSEWRSAAPLPIVRSERGKGLLNRFVLRDRYLGALAIFPEEGSDWELSAGAGSMLEDRFFRVGIVFDRLVNHHLNSMSRGAAELDSIGKAHKALPNANASSERYAAAVNRLLCDRFGAGFCGYYPLLEDERTLGEPMGVSGLGATLEDPPRKRFSQRLRTLLQQAIDDPEIGWRNERLMADADARRMGQRLLNDHRLPFEVRAGTFLKVRRGAEDAMAGVLAIFPEKGVFSRFETDLLAAFGGVLEARLGEAPTGGGGES